jgi:uncharacterized protein (TIGR02145 family)
MKKIILLIVVSLLIHTVKSQNIECVGKTITIPLTGYKIGSIQWQFSTNTNEWTDLSGKTTTTLQYSLTQTGYFRAKITYGQCDYYSDITYINVIPVPTASNAGLDINITTNDTITTLGANNPISGKGKWTIISGNGGVFTNDTLPNSTFKGKSCNDYVLRWTISTGCMNSMDDVKIGFHATPTTANAGNDIVLTNIDTVVKLSANSPEIGKGYWTITKGAGGLLVDSLSPITNFKGQKNVLYTLKWTTFTECNQTTDNVNIIFLSEDNTFDIDGNIYKTVTIGNQKWMAENLKTTKYNDGKAIPLVADEYNWPRLTSEAYCWHTNSIYENFYGAYYNWYAVNTKKICPIGWHVPSDAEWSILTTYLGGESISGGKLKEIGSTHWNQFNSENIADNSYGFTALPGGFRNGEVGMFVWTRIYGYWWSSSEFDNTNAYFRSMFSGDIAVTKNNWSKKFGFSVRCIKD